MKKKLSPFVVRVGDYHEFYNISYYFEAAGFAPLEYKEFDVLEPYYAVFYQKGDKKKADKIVANWKKNHLEEKSS